MLGLRLIDGVATLSAEGRTGTDAGGERVERAVHRVVPDVDAEDRGTERVNLNAEY